MNCHLIKPKIYQYAQRTLAEEEQHFIRIHLEKCQSCMRDYLEWLELEYTFELLEKQEPPLNFTQNIMDSINRVFAAKKNETFWLANYYRNFGRGLIAAGILGLLINCSFVAANLPLESSVEKGLQVFAEAGNKYFQLYDRVSSIRLDNWKLKGGNFNEM